MGISTLADHLRHHAGKRPDAPALICAEGTWSHAELLAEARQRATTIQPTASKEPLIVAGDSVQLAFAAYAASLESRPFWPVDRSTPAIATEIPEETALIISTSGSEGHPRAVLLSHANLATAAHAANRQLAFAPGDLWLNCMPLNHIGGQSILWRCAVAGATQLLHRGFSLPEIDADLTRWPVSHISLVPVMLARLLEAGIKPPESLRVALIGGAALNPSLYEQAKAAGWPLYPSYGMSETAAMLTVWQPGTSPWQAGLVGHCPEDHEIAIAGDSRIRVRGPQVMLGYLGGPRLPADGWLTTSDLGQFDEHGQLHVHGRADDMLISGGTNVHPLSVEHCLAGCPGVGDIAVTGLPDPVWGDLVVALVVGPVDDETLLAHARQHLPKAATPRRIVRLERLPRTPAGKLERAILRRIAAGNPP